jgi:hypothetical protein
MPQSNILSIQFILNASGCLFYFYEVFAEPPDMPLRNHPVFWIVSGIFLLSSLSVPFSLIMTESNMADHFMFMVLFSIRAFAYVILFIFLHTALKCQVNLR